MWHASAQTQPRSRERERELVFRFLENVGDSFLGQWEELSKMATHLRRRVSDQERALAGFMQVRDIRGTEEAFNRMRTLLAEAPHLRHYFDEGGIK